ncbi:MAG: flotillin family protein [Bacteroidales bacterium]|jgi:flotillin|nr:SPFH domain-containing protein [Bacteroidales bacterium]MCK9499878.1 SPFH domain-containing protein [Bacteroidales bacterium]MDY0314883.1 SPFH domain-containing protein [Bacteroidales bacterium]NLB86308.1 flotillin family protein [Bacteroidales bacterium]
MGGEYFILIIAFAVFFIFIMIVTFLRRYKRCPSDRILVIYGKVGKRDSEYRTAKCIHGGAAFIWPVIQDYQFLELTPFSIEINLRSALSKQNIRVDVPSRFTVGVSTEDSVMTNAAERLLGLTQTDISKLAEDILFGQLRLVVATMDIEEINSNRDKFLEAVSSNVEAELKKIGLKLINVNVTDLNDESGYIIALGKEAAAKAINDAKKSVAEKNRDGEIGQAEAEKEQRVKVADAVAYAKIGEANANREERIKTSEADANAVEGENLAKITIAKSDALRREQEAEAERLAITAEKVKRAKALEDAYSAEKIAEENRALRDKATQYANVVVPTEIDKQKIEIAADAIAEQTRRLAKGEADAILLKMQAEGKGIYEILSKQAEGFDKIVKAAGDNSRDAVLLMIADKLPEIVKHQVEAIKNLKIDKITVWDNMGAGSQNGKPTTANFLSGMLGAVPPFEELFKMAGMELPDYLKGKPKAENSEEIIAPDSVEENNE